LQPHCNTSPDHSGSGENVDIHQPDLAAAATSMTTRKAVEYLYTTTALGLRVSPFYTPGTTGELAPESAMRWCLLEYRVDTSDIDREVAQYFSLTAPKAIVDARQALSEAKAKHLTDIVDLELDLEEAEQRWTNACRQKLQTLRVRLTETRAKSAPDSTGAATRVSNGAELSAMVPHYFIYLGSQGSLAAAQSGSGRSAPLAVELSNPAQLRARNYLGGWLQEDDVEVDVATLPGRGWPLAAFRQWIEEIMAMRHKSHGENGASASCVLAATEGRCFVMDLHGFARHYLTPGR
jgi:hypothetical protein